MFVSYLFKINLYGLFHYSDVLRKMFNLLQYANEIIGNLKKTKKYSN